MTYIVFIDLGLLAVMAFCLVVAGAEILASWLLENIGIVFAFLLIKSIVLFAVSRMFSCIKGIFHIVCIAIVLLLDVGRSLVFLYCIMQLLNEMLSGGLFELLLGIGVVPLIGCILIIVGEGPICLVYCEDVSNSSDVVVAIVLEIVSIAALLLFAYAAQRSGGWF